MPPAWEEPLIDDLLADRLEAVGQEDAFEDAVERGEVEVGGGDGGTLDTAVVIEAPDTLLGATAQQLYLERVFGPRLHKSPRRGEENPRGWFLRRQQVVQRGVERFEQLDLTLHDGAARTVYFEISSFFGKEPSLG